MLDSGWWLKQMALDAAQKVAIHSSASSSAVHLKCYRKKTKKNSNGSILHFNAASWWHKFSNLLYLCICSPTPDTDTDDIDVDAFMYTAMGHLHF